MQLQIWIERVPSQSDPSDKFSREEVCEFEGSQRRRVELHEESGVSARPMCKSISDVDILNSLFNMRRQSE